MSNLSKVKAGDTITIEWRKMKGGVGLVKCIFNDPVNKRILIEIAWVNKGIQRSIWEYKADQFANFERLNPKFKTEDRPPTVKDLKQQLQEAIECEDYEKARQIQNKIDSMR